MNWFFDFWDSVFNPVWHQAKKQMDQAVEAAVALMHDKASVEACLENAGYEVGSIIEDVGAAFKSVWSTMKWILLGMGALFVLWMFFGRKR